MGILNGNVLCTSLRENSTVPFTKFELGDTILYIDGPILLFSGNISPQYKLISEQHKLYCIKSKLRRIVEFVSAKFAVSKVLIVFDGIAPKEKASTQKSRAKRINNEFNPTEMKAAFYNYMLIHQMKIPHEIIQLEYGEAESYIYFHRDLARNSVMYTKDTDFYVLAYKHQQLQEHDNVFMCNDIKTCLEIYCMADFYYSKLSALGFRLIMALSGSDYTKSRFTPSMVSVLFDVFADINKNHVELCNTFNIQIENSETLSAIKTLLDIVEVAKSDFPNKRVCKKRPDSTINDGDALPRKKTTTLKNKFLMERVDKRAQSVIAQLAEFSEYDLIMYNWFIKYYSGLIPPDVAEPSKSLDTCIFPQIHCSVIV
jgi:hypothetical protein